MNPAPPTPAHATADAAVYPRAGRATPRRRTRAPRRRAHRSSRNNDGNRSRVVAGFSLIEMMIVVVVLAIASALVVPRMSSASSTQVTWAAQMLAADLQAAQSESMSHPDDPRVVVVKADGTSYWIAAASDPATPVNNPLEQKPWLLAFGDGRGKHLAHVVMPANNIGPDMALGFGRYGEPDQTHDAVFVLGADSHIAQVTVAFDTGTVTVGPLQPSSDLSSLTLPGPVGDTNQWITFWNALLAGSTSAYNVGTGN